MLWLKESIKKGKKLKDSWSLNGIQLFIKDKLPNHIELDVVIEYIMSRIPFHMMKGIDIIYIGEFEEMNIRDINAYFEDGAIYLTNVQDNEMDIIDDIIHEIAHAVEREYSNLIYTGFLEREFLAKRERLYSMLIAEGYNISPVFKVKTEYDRDIDEFLYKEIGYEKLDNLVNGLFISAYASTSLSEYFARGFEEFYMGDIAYFKKVSPVLYSILESLKDMED
tara:strand:+ start:290 stop:958 length:669 start_codon:yes stop_codon:yes gene_type:complete